MKRLRDLWPHLIAFDPSVQAWLGHARHTDTLGLCQGIFDAIPFIRGADR